MKNIKNFDSFITESNIVEGEGIHPAIREKLFGYLKDNPKATFSEARDHISDQIKGWKLTEEDFEEAKKQLTSN
jgi:hypothetical protein